LKSDFFKYDFNDPITFPSIEKHCHLFTVLKENEGKKKRERKNSLTKKSI